MVKEEHYFITKDGREVKSLFELSQALEDMPEDVFNHHVSDEGNDFSNWVQHVMKNKSLADSIAAVKDKKSIQEVIRAKLEKDIKKTMVKKPRKTAKKIAAQKVIKGLSFKKEDIISKITNSSKQKQSVGEFVDGIPRGLLEFLFGVAVGLLIYYITTTL